MVTLRGERMFEFLDRLISIAPAARARLPRRVAEGVRRPRQLHHGLRDQLLFPEIDYMKVDKARGMNVSVVTTAKTDEEARKLLQLMACRSAPTRGQGPAPRRIQSMATTAKIAKEAKTPKYKIRLRNAAAVRASARLHAEVRDVPPLLPQGRARRRCDRGDEELLVRGSKKAGSFFLLPPDEIRGTMTDPISDMLTRLRNAVSAKHTRVDLPASKLKAEIARILQDEGYIQGFRLVEEPAQKAGRQPRQVIRIFLKYGPHGEKVISGLERISRPGRRVYLGVDDVPAVLGGWGPAS
jgi:small subunit ribosomal protein S8